MKFAAWIVFIFLLLAGGVVGIVLPNQFHKIIHKEIIAKSELNPATSKIYKKLNYHNHLTTLSTEDHETKIISVTSLDPRDYHLLVNVRRKRDGNQFDFKILGKISDNLEIHFQFKDYLSDEPENKLSVKTPSIILSTPLNRNLLDAEKRVWQILSNTKINLNIGLIDSSWIETAEIPQQNSAKLENISWSLATSSPDNKSIKVTNVFAIKEYALTTKEYQETFKNIQQSMTIDSFNQNGIKDIYKEFSGVSNKDGLPMQAKLMPLLGKISTVVTSPFQMTFTGQQDQVSGQSQFEFKVSLSDLTKSFMETLAITANASIPKDSFQKLVMGFMTERLIKQYEADLYQTGGDPFADRAKLELTFKNFLNDEVDGKKNIQLAFDKAVELELLTEKEEKFFLKASFGAQGITINDRPFTSFEMPQLFEPQKITDYMLANGFQSRLLEAQKEWLLFEDPKLIKEYQTRTMLIAKKTPKKDVICKVEYKDLNGPQSQTLSAKAADKAGLPCLSWCKDTLQQKAIMVHGMSHREGVKCYSDDIIQAF